MNKTDFVGAFAKGLMILEAFGPERPRLSIAEASDLTGLDRATARRYLLTLHELGYVDYDGKHFSLTPSVLRLGVSAVAALPLPRVVQPWIDALAEKIGESASVSILDDLDIVYIARASEKRVMSIGLMPGSRLPAHCTSMGRVLLASLPQDEAQKRIRAANLSPRTPMSLTRPEEIFARVLDAYDRGYAIVDQEVEMGLRSIAVPLFSRGGQVVAALNTGVAAVQDSASRLRDLYLDALLEVQNGLRRLISSR